ncbi:replication-relaxation family protein [Peribacillus simplex]|uniref:replication-relaxation family protein n=1 Tax=Peribacillus simplex TaxID=1478 RepID=UPI0021A994CC|nr:replication-relaxation family protein [Peribacillus simplex]
MKKLDFLNRDQIIKLHRLGKVRNANRVLGELSDYLCKYREEYMTIYYLNSAGRDYVDCDKVRKKGNKVSHSLARNDFYIHAKCPFDWTNEMKIGDAVEACVCDALFKSNGKYFALEVDLTQSISENKLKAKKYKGIFERKVLEKELGNFPTVIWLTNSELRRKQLTEISKGFPYMVLTLNDIR